MLVHPDVVFVRTHLNMHLYERISKTLSEAVGGGGLRNTKRFFFECSSPPQSYSAITAAVTLDALLVYTHTHKRELTVYILTMASYVTIKWRAVKNNNNKNENEKKLIKNTYYEYVCVCGAVCVCNALFSVRVRVAPRIFGEPHDMHGTPYPPPSRVA